MLQEKQTVMDLTQLPLWLRIASAFRRKRVPGEKMEEGEKRGGTGAIEAYCIQLRNFFDFSFHGTHISSSKHF